MLKCPECESTEVCTVEETAFMANTFDFYCHSVKPHDSDARAFCTKCAWFGQRQDLIETEEYL
jgi:hypothetical protein